jgi:hypothetical protein
VDFLREPSLIRSDWRQYFEKFFKEDEVVAKPRIVPSFRPASLFNSTARASVDGAARVGEAEVATLQDRVDVLIRNYRVRGHMICTHRPGGSAAGQVLPNLIRSSMLHRSRYGAAFLLRDSPSRRATQTPRDPSNACATPTAARSAYSSCTSTIYLLGGGSRNVWRARKTTSS